MGFYFNTDSLTPSTGSGGGGGEAVITSLNVTPTTSAQTITAPSGTDGYSPVNVGAVTAAIDNNISAENIVSGVSILGVSGSAVELNGETVSITPSTSQQIITPTSPKNGITQATVAAVTSSIDANITAGNIVSGVSILGVNGAAIELNATTESVTPTTSSQTVTPTSPYNGFSSVTVSGVTAAIDNNITAGNIKKDVVILGVTGSYEGSGGGGGGKYALLDRVSDDGGNEIGTVSGFFTDANDVEYAVVCLDAQYRLEQGTYCSNTSTAVTDLPIYSNWAMWEVKETATFNTQKILDFCTAQSATSTACTHCRSKSFTIDGTIYYGQLPNIVEVIDICKNYTAIQSADTSVSQYSSLGLPRTSDRTWSSSQYSSSNGYLVSYNGNTSSSNKTTNYFVAPVLEIPNT